MCSSQNGNGRAWWHGVEVRHFAALASVAREGSFRGAAEALGYVQSAVSQQVAQLETVVGRRLILRKRGSAPVALTEAGEVLLGHADEIMARLAAAHADLDALGDGDPDSFRVGVLEAVAPHLMPRVLPPLLRRMPDLRVAATAARDPGELLGRLEKGELDAAFCLGAALDTRFVSIRLLSVPFVLLASVGSELATRAGAPDPHELAGLRLIAHDLMPEVEPQLRRLGVAPRAGVRMGSGAAVQALVAAGLGAAILPAFAVSRHDPRVACRPLDGLVAPATLSLVWRRGGRTPPALRYLIETADRSGQALERELRAGKCGDPREAASEARPVGVAGGGG